MRILNVCLAASLCLSVRGNMRNIAILGGGQAAISVAETVQEQGWKAYVIAPENHLGGALASSNHCWILNGTTGESLMRPVGSLQKELYARAMDCGADPLPLSHCAGFLVADKAVKAVAIANKFGVFLLPVAAVIDASHEQIAANHISGCLKSESVIVEYNFEIARAHAFTGNSWVLPSAHVEIHRTLRDGNLCVSFRENRVLDERDWLSSSRMQMDLRRKAVDLVSEIRKAVPGLQDAQIARFAAPRIIASERECNNAFGNLLRVKGTFPERPTTHDVRIIERNAEEQTRDFVKNLKTSKPDFQGELLSTGQRLAFALSDWQDPDVEGLPLARIEITPASEVRYDAAVIGGGTGGSSAMSALASQKIHAITVDMLPFLGGTTTVGGVSGAWHGYTKGAYEDYTKGRNALVRAESLSSFCASIRHWDKILLDPENRQDFAGSTVVCGTAKEQDRVTGVLLYSNSGFKRLEAKIYLDMTGEATLCDQAGMKTELGDPDTGWIQSSSCWGLEYWTTSNFQQNHFANDLDVVDPTCYKDVIRGIGLAHRKNSDYHISQLYTQREARRIIGEHHLNVKDILTRKFHGDAIAVSFCLFDTHGRLSTEIPLRCITNDAYDPEDKEVHVLIPVGTFIPKGLANVLVGAKAISGERDATSLCRMNPEITNAGFSLGLLASQFITQKLGNTRDADIRALRQQLIQRKILPSWAEKPSTPEWTVEFAVERLSEPDGFLPALLMPKEQIVPKLKELFQQKQTRQVAYVLAYFGELDGQKLLLKELKQQMSIDMHEVRDSGVGEFTVVDIKGEAFTSDKRSNYGVPVFGALKPGKAYGMVNRIVGFLCHLDSEETLEPVLQLTERAWAGGTVLNTGNTPYAIARTDGTMTYFHGRLWIIATFFNARPTPRAIQPLTKLLNEQFVGGNIVNEDWSDVPPLQMTYLEVMLAQALHRCGGEEGTQRLQAFTNDSRAIFRNMAKAALKNQPRNPAK